MEKVYSCVLLTSHGAKELKKHATLPAIPALPRIILDSDPAGIKENLIGADVTVTAIGYAKDASIECFYVSLDTTNHELKEYLSKASVPYLVVSAIPGRISDNAPTPMEELPDGISFTAAGKFGYIVNGSDFRF